MYLGDYDCMNNESNITYGSMSRCNEPDQG